MMPWGPCTFQLRFVSWIKRRIKEELIQLLQQILQSYNKDRRWKCELSHEVKNSPLFYFKFKSEQAIHYF